MCFQGMGCVGSFKISSYCSYRDMLCISSFVFILFVVFLKIKSN